MSCDLCADCLCNSCLMRLSDGKKDCRECEICFETEEDVKKECKRYIDIGGGAALTCMGVKVTLS